MAAWVCQVCGGTFKHVDENGRYKCDSCGTEVVTPEDEQKCLHYAQTVKLAKDNLMVGNWDTAKQLVYRLMKDYPSDSTLYLIAMAAVTKGYTDVLVNNSTEAQRKEAAWCWDKLEALNAVNSVMVEYRQRKRETEKIEIKRLKRLSVWLVIAAVFAALIFPEAIVLFIVGILIHNSINKGTDKVLTVARVKGKCGLNNQSHSNPFR